MSKEAIPNSAEYGVIIHPSVQRFEFDKDVAPHYEKIGELVISAGSWPKIRTEFTDSSKPVYVPEEFMADYPMVAVPREYTPLLPDNQRHRNRAGRTFTKATGS